MHARILITLAVSVAGAIQLSAQPSGGPVWSGAPGVAGAAGAPPPGPGQNVLYFNVGFGPGQVVKNAPYSAQSTTEFTQVLADGNRIDRKQTGRIYRDSEGRTRREETIGPIGLLPVAAAPKQMIFIADPVAGVTYVLDPVKKTAEKMPLPKTTPTASGERMIRRIQVFDSSGAMKGSAPAGAVILKMEEHANANPADGGSTSNLGTRMFDAVQADGTRLVNTIAAGQMGNQRPIEIVDERWYSPQLQLVVMTRHSDPRMGETVYELSNIRLDEPAHSLFEVPADYQLVEPRLPPEMLNK